MKNSEMAEISHAAAKVLRSGLFYALPRKRRDALMKSFSKAVRWSDLSKSDRVWLDILSADGAG